MKETLENVVVTGHVEDKSDKGTQRINDSTNLREWLEEQRIGEIAKRLRVTNDRK